MKKSLGKGLLGAINLAPATTRMPLLKALVPREGIALFYHMVSDAPVDHTDHIYPHRPVELFEEDLQFLAQNYHPISYHELRQHREEGRKLPREAVHLSFDDGFAECYHLARPLLLKYDIPCTFFLATDFIDNQRMYYRNQVSLCLAKFDAAGQAERKAMLEDLNDEFGTVLSDGPAFEAWAKALVDEGEVARMCGTLGVDVPAYLAERKPYLTQEQVRGLLADGFTIGAHSRRHAKLGRLSPKEAEEEIVESCLIAGRMTGSAGVPFSFPNSGDGLDRDFLARIRTDHRAVGLYFDTKGLREDRRFIVNRIWAEAPRLSPAGKEVMAGILERAYREQVFQSGS